MPGLIISVGLDEPLEIVRVLTSYGEIGQIGDSLFAINTKNPIDSVRHEIQLNFPNAKYIFVAEVADHSFRGDGKLSFASSILKN